MTWLANWWHATTSMTCFFFLAVLAIQPLRTRKTSHKQKTVFCQETEHFVTNILKRGKISSSCESNPLLSNPKSFFLCQLQTSDLFAWVGFSTPEKSLTCDRNMQTKVQSATNHVKEGNRTIVTRPKLLLWEKEISLGPQKFHANNQNVSMKHVVCDTVRLTQNRHWANSRSKARACIAARFSQVFKDAPNKRLLQDFLVGVCMCSFRAPKFDENLSLSRLTQMHTTTAEKCHFFNPIFTCFCVEHRLTVSDCFAFLVHTLSSSTSPGLTIDFSFQRTCHFWRRRLLSSLCSKMIHHRS